MEVRRVRAQTDPQKAVAFFQPDEDVGGSEEEEESSSGDSEDGEDESPPAPGRRLSRHKRSIEEKAGEWKFVRQPAFQDWAVATAVSGQEQPVPEQLRSATPQLIAAPLALERTTSVQLPLPQSLRSPANIVRTSSGSVQTFMRSHAPPAATCGPRARILTDAERIALDTSTKQRANEQCMPLYVDAFLKRQTVRAEQMFAAASPVAGGRQRAIVTQEANRFDECYGTVQTVIARNISFHPPARSNSIALGEIHRMTHQRPQA